MMAIQTKPSDQVPLNQVFKFRVLPIMAVTSAVTMRLDLVIVDHEC